MEGDSSHEDSVAEAGWDQDPPEINNEVLDDFLGHGNAARGGGVHPEGQASRGGSVHSHSSVPTFVGGRVSVGSAASRSIQPIGNYFN